MRLGHVLAVPFVLLFAACGGDVGSSENTGNQNQSACGNGQIESWEECDDGALNSDTLIDACRTNCSAAECGDGVVDSGEECDGDELGGVSCANYVS